MGSRGRFLLRGERLVLEFAGEGGAEYHCNWESFVAGIALYLCYIKLEDTVGMTKIIFWIISAFRVTWYISRIFVCPLPQTSRWIFPSQFNYFGKRAFILSKSSFSLGEDLLHWHNWILKKRTPAPRYCYCLGADIFRETAETTTQLSTQTNVLTKDVLLQPYHFCKYIIVYK